MMETGVVMASRVDQVRSVFDESDWYFKKRGYDVRIRAETIRELAGFRDNARILDIGCGDGSISRPLLTENTRVTLLDISSNMLSMARSKAPLEFVENIETINRDFMEVTFEPQSFDLILCIGVLVHVASHPHFIAKMVSLLKPGGNIIVECTDSRHFVSKLLNPFYWVKGQMSPSKYSLNQVDYSKIVEIFNRHQFHPAAAFRYSQPIPGFHRVFSQENLYKLNRKIFGTPRANRNVWAGNEYISVFSRTVETLPEAR
jgi:ubiquinone/menaquinone biosynthesis C-methylase UbiE